MIAAAWGHTQTVANLLKHGANVTITDGKFRTALHYCVDQSSPSLTTIHVLCNKGKLIFSLYYHVIMWLRIYCCLCLLY